jgi:hypothetical protein
MNVFNFEPRLTVAIILCALFLSCPRIIAAAKHDPAPNIVGETIGQVAARTGYTIEDLKENFPAIEEWAELGVKLAPDRLAASYAKDRFRAPPAPGVHPRVYFNPEDLLVIR